MSFIIVHGTVENVMRSRFNIKMATANRIPCILKTMFEFVFTQMTKAYAQSYSKSNSSMNFTFKNIMWIWLDKIQDIVFHPKTAEGCGGVRIDFSDFLLQRN